MVVKVPQVLKEHPKEPLEVKELRELRELRVQMDYPKDILEDKVFKGLKEQ